MKNPHRSGLKTLTTARVASPRCSRFFSISLKSNWAASSTPHYPQSSSSLLQRQRPSGLQRLNRSERAADGGKTGDWCRTGWRRTRMRLQLSGLSGPRVHCEEDRTRTSASEFLYWCFTVSWPSVGVNQHVKDNLSVYTDGILSILFPTSSSQRKQWAAAIAPLWCQPPLSNPWCWANGKESNLHKSPQIVRPISLKWADIFKRAGVFFGFIRFQVLWFLCADPTLL